MGTMEERWANATFAERMEMAKGDPVIEYCALVLESMDAKIRIADRQQREVERLDAMSGDEG